MIEMKVLNAKYPARVKDYLWSRETRQTIELLQQGKSLGEIKELSETENVYNAISKSRANEIRMAVFRRLRTVDKEFLAFFVSQTVEIQKILCLVLVMLSDHTFLRFMDEVYREKLIVGNTDLSDADFFSFLHKLQAEDEHAAKWTDAALGKIRDNFKSILREGGLLTEAGNPRKILRPLMGQEQEEFFQAEGIGYLYKILTGERE